MTLQCDTSQLIRGVWAAFLHVVQAIISSVDSETFQMFTSVIFPNNELVKLFPGLVFGNLFIVLMLFNQIWFTKKKRWSMFFPNSLCDQRSSPSECCGTSTCLSRVVLLDTNESTGVNLCPLLKLYQLLVWRTLLIFRRGAVEFIGVLLNFAHR